MDLARSTAESLFQESCDIIIPVGGAINLPAGDVINDTGLNAALVGVDADAYFAMPEQYQPLWLTTVEKAIGPLVALSVQQQAEVVQPAGDVRMALAVRRALEAEVPAEVPRAYLQGDICRASLLTEIDGIVNCRPTKS